jgi:hypothetical protein
LNSGCLSGCNFLGTANVNDVLASALNQDINDVSESFGDIVECTDEAPPLILCSRTRSSATGAPSEPCRHAGAEWRAGLLQRLVGRDATGAEPRVRSPTGGHSCRGLGQAGVTVPALAAATGVQYHGGSPQHLVAPEPSAAIALVPVHATKTIRQAERPSSAAGRPGWA